MNFTQIFHGMVGRDFIKAFNDNFTITDETFIKILATLIYKVKSTDIKEFKVIDNVVSYTLEEAPTEGEDTRTWTPVDITKWGNIQGDITEQTDLWNILENKAAVDTVATINNLLSTLTQEFNQVKSQVEANTSNVRTNTNDIADILEAIVEKVNSTNIKAIRVNNTVFQWSPDGRTWYEQPITTSIAWGHLTGDITTQEDLMTYFTNINNSITSLDGTINSLQNSMTELEDNLSALSTSFDSHLSEYTSYKNQVSTDIANIRRMAEDATGVSTSLEEQLGTHINNTNNPHNVSKAQLNIENIDNTADIDKPLSTAQKTYIDNEIARVEEEIIVANNGITPIGSIQSIFIGNNTAYNNLGNKNEMLAFVLDDKFFTTNLTITSNNYQFDLLNNGNIVNPTSETSTSKTYENINSSNDYSISYNGTQISINNKLNFSITMNNINLDEIGGNA